MGKANGEYLAKEVRGATLSYLSNGNMRNGRRKRERKEN
jgi:hypothetical protein